MGDLGVQLFWVHQALGCCRGCSPPASLSEQAVTNPLASPGGLGGGTGHRLHVALSASKIESFLALHLWNCLNCLFPFLKSLSACNYNHSHASRSPAHPLAPCGS